MANALNDKYLDYAHQKLAKFAKAYKISSSDTLSDDDPVLELLEHLDWSTHSVEALTDDLNGSEGAIGHLKDAMDEFTSAQHTLAGGWTGKASDGFQRIAKLVEKNYGMLEDELESMTHDIGPQAAGRHASRPHSQSAVEKMTELTQAVNDKADDIATSTGGSVDYVLQHYGSSDFSDEEVKNWSAAVDEVNSAFDDLKKTVHTQIKSIGSEVEPIVAAHDESIRLVDPTIAQRQQYPGSA